MHIYILVGGFLCFNFLFQSANAHIFNSCYRNCTKKVATQVLGILNKPYKPKQHQKIITLVQTCFDPKQCSPRYTENFRKVIGNSLEGSQIRDSVKKELCKAQHMPCTIQSYSYNQGDCQDECTPTVAGTLGDKLNSPSDGDREKDIALLRKCVETCAAHPSFSSFKAKLGNSLSCPLKPNSLLYYICSQQVSLAKIIVNTYKDYPSKKTFVDACEKASSAYPGRTNNKAPLLKIT